MLKANELRIGSQTEVGVVTGIYESNGIYSVQINNSFAFAMDKINPIPLTEEWLLKFGFEKRDKLIYDNIRLPDGGFGEFHEAIDYMLGVYKCQVLKKDNNFFYLIGFSSGDIQDDFITKEIKYVNQLQNIHFALTGEELDIKQPSLHNNQRIA